MRILLLLFISFSASAQFSILIQQESDSVVLQIAKHTCDTSKVEVKEKDSLLYIYKKKKPTKR